MAITNTFVIYKTNNTTNTSIHHQLSVNTNALIHQLSVDSTSCTSIIITVQIDFTASKSILFYVE